jgi:methylenetetrahydrofolate dehydrogenase (NADP+)/methenyltetrahydrofolate cyclohydrolase
METKIIKGDLIKDKIFREVKTKVAQLEQEIHCVPGIAFIGFDCTPLNKYNIPLHVKMAREMGFSVTTRILPNESTEEEVFKVIDQMNIDTGIDAIVLLQPLPDHLNPVRIVNRIDPVKEVEGFHPQNILSTMVPDIHTARYPMCLPEALYEMFLEENVHLRKNLEWVFILDESFFANTLTKMIVRAAASRVVPDDCSVTFINKESEQLLEYCKRADVLVVVTKFPEYIQPEWIKPGAIIIDIYSNLVREVPSKEDPNRMVPVIRGGVNASRVEGIAGILLPIPGGLMTVVMAILFRNTLSAFMNRMKLNAA